MPKEKVIFIIDFSWINNVFIGHGFNNISTILIHIQECSCISDEMKEWRFPMKLFLSGFQLFKARVREVLDSTSGVNLDDFLDGTSCIRAKNEIKGIYDEQ